MLEEFLGLYFHDPAVGLLRAAEAELVAARPLPRPLLDLGCGDGSFAARTVRGPGTIGLDRDFRRARRARASRAYSAVVVADAHRLPFRDGVFAAVLSNSTLEHLPGVGDVLREAARVLAAGGRLVFTVHNDRFAGRMFFWPRLFALLGRREWTERYRHARLHRLAMENLLDIGEWEALLGAAGLEARESVGYLRGRADLAFERWLVLARFGVGRVHVGAALRTVNRALAALGLRLHRRLAGRLLARWLGPDSADREGEPAAILIEAQRRPDVIAEALPAAGVVVDFVRYRGR